MKNQERRCNGEPRLQYVRSITWISFFEKKINPQVFHNSKSLINKAFQELIQQTCGKL